MPNLDELARKDFIRAIVADDLQSGKHQRVATRFPPEPNGYLHIGHAKAICTNFGIAQEFGGVCRLRYDDTNPETEEDEFVLAMQEDIRWLGWEWEGEPRFASDYFDQLVDWAKVLIGKGLAYVDFSDDETIRSHRGTVKEAGTPTPDRSRTIQDNAALFDRMLVGDFADGECVLRAKIDLAHPNMKMRDPLMYRVRHIAHHHAGDKWCVYPFYDWAHGQSDAYEGVTHSLCTLEFENNRELYDWYLVHAVPEPHPRQIEFARMTISHWITSKRKMKALVEGGHVSGWDDPRMPTLAGQRRRGVPAAAIRNLVDRLGLAKAANSLVPYEWFEGAVRDELNRTAPRRMGVLDPLKVVITTWDEGAEDTLELADFPTEFEQEGSRSVTFGRELWIDRSDFALEPPRKWKRLAPGAEVRLRGAYLVRCDEVIERDGEVVELRCSHDPDSRGGRAPDGRKVQGTIHWVSAAHAIPATVRQYDRLFSVDEPGSARDFIEDLTPDSRVDVRAWLEPSLFGAAPGTTFQLERTGYFCVDRDSGDELVLNRTVTLRETWAKPAEAPADAGSAHGSGPRSAVPAAVPEETVRAELSEAEAGIAADLQRRFGLSDDAARELATASDWRTLFEEAVAVTQHPVTLANLVLNDVRGLAKDGATFDAAQVAAVAELFGADTISSRGATEALAHLAAHGGTASAAVESLGLRQVSDADAVQAMVQGVLAAHPDEVTRFRGGERKLQGFFMGQVMKASRGKADPKVAARVLGRLLNG